LRDLRDPALRDLRDLRDPALRDLRETAFLLILKTLLIILFILLIRALLDLDDNFVLRLVFL